MKNVPYPDRTCKLQMLNYQPSTINLIVVPRITLPLRPLSSLGGGQCASNPLSNLVMSPTQEDNTHNADESFVPRDAVAWRRRRTTSFTMSVRQRSLIFRHDIVDPDSRTYCGCTADGLSMACARRLQSLASCAFFAGRSPHSARGHPRIFRLIQPADLAQRNTDARSRRCRQEEAPTSDRIDTSLRW